MEKLKNLDAALDTLFSLSGDAVLGIRDRRVVFANPSSKELFGCDSMGQKAESILPGYLFEQNTDHFICSAELCGRTVSISVSSADGLSLLSIPREEPFSAAIPPGILSEVRSAVYNLKMASDQIIAPIPFGTDAKPDKYASIFYHNYYSLLRLTNNLNAVTALLDGSMPFSPVPSDLGLLCSELVSSVKYFIRDRGVELSFTCAPDDMTTNLDRDKIEHLILNLLSNSLLHTSPGDKISMDLRRSASGLILAIDDTGSGISQEKLSSIFSIQRISPASVSDAGSGLGLFIARGIAQLHGGALIIDSREGQGTSIRVMLPADGDTVSRFREADTDYRVEGVHNILTELSGVLGPDAYIPEHFD